MLNKIQGICNSKKKCLKQFRVVPPFLYLYYCFIKLERGTKHFYYNVNVSMLQKEKLYNRIKSWI